MTRFLINFSFGFCPRVQCQTIKTRFIGNKFLQTPAFSLRTEANSNIERCGSWLDENRLDEVQTNLVNGFCLAKQLKTAKYESHVQSTIFYQSKFYLIFTTSSDSLNLRNTFNENFSSSLPENSFIAAKYFSLNEVLHTRCIFVSLGRWQMTFNSRNFCSKCDAGFFVSTPRSIAMNLARAQLKPIFLHKDSFSFSRNRTSEKSSFLRFHTLHFVSCNWLNNCRCKQITNVLPFNFFARTKNFQRFSSFQQAYPGPSLDSKIRSREFVIYMPAASLFFLRTVEAGTSQARRIIEFSKFSVALVRMFQSHRRGPEIDLKYKSQSWILLAREMQQFST